MGGWPGITGYVLKAKERRRERDGNRENGRKVGRRTVGGGENGLEREKKRGEGIWGPHLEPKRSLEVITPEQNGD